METLDTIWESSRTNEWSVAYPLSIALGIVAILFLVKVQRTGVRRLLICLAIGTFGLLATDASGRSISRKWQIRHEWAANHRDQITDRQQQGLISDGANLVLGPILDGLQAIPLLMIAGVVAEVGATIRKNKRQEQCESSSHGAGSGRFTRQTGFAE